MWGKLKEKAEGTQHSDETGGVLRKFERKNERFNFGPKIVLVINIYNSRRVPSVFW